ncbi:MAG TPA: DUF4142 domain-containing protein [Sphingomonadaceae bacterium]|nr:DUF4142 domain-containing protein [Sphingomonadaceae bacterium]
MKAVNLILLGFAGALAACNPDNTDPANGNTPDTDAALADNNALTDSTATSPAPAQAFVDQMSASDLYEIEAGQLAQENGDSQKVKDFGTMMVENHNQSTSDLKAAAGSASPPLGVAPSLTPAQDDMLQQLRDAGDGFDALYARQQVTAHEAALKSLRDYAANGQSAELREFATKTANVVEKHLAEARKLP